MVNNYESFMIIASSKFYDNCKQFYDNCYSPTPIARDIPDSFTVYAMLYLSNIQQGLQKATFGILKVCDKFVDQQPRTDKETRGANIDAIVLLGHDVRSFPAYDNSRLKRPLKPNLTRFTPGKMSRAVVPICSLGLT